MYKMEIPVMDYAANDVARRADVYLDRIDDRFYAGDEYESNWVLPGHGHYYKHCGQPVCLSGAWRNRFIRRAPPMSRS